MLVCFGVKAQNVTIPDANFKAYLVGNSAINTNGDTEIQVSEANAFTGSINCSSQNISSLTGIEAFVNLTELYCEINNLSSLDVSQNTALTVLYLNNNGNLNTLDLTQNIALTSLRCGYNSMSNLNLTQNINLESLQCYNNSLTNLDLSQNTALTYLMCQNNSLTSLNVANYNNTEFIMFNASNNPNLTCIEVDDVNYSTTNWTNIDATASFSTNCSSCTINIPDANFKAYLVGNSAINTNSDNEIQCSEATAFTGSIFASSLNITDLTGIEAFTSLNELWCGSNLFTSLDLSQNTALTKLVTSYSYNLNTIDLSQNLNLTFLGLEGNTSLSSIDISHNTALVTLRIDETDINTLDVSQNINLEQLSCNYCSIGTLDLSQNTSLEIFENYLNSSITTLDLSNNTNLTSIDCSNNTNLNTLNLKNISTSANLGATDNPNLTCIEVDDVAAATSAWTNIDATASFSLDCNSLSKNNYELAENISIYPNPATSRIYINSNEVIESIAIIDVFGKTIERSLTFKNGINISKLSKGIYFLQINTNKGLAIKKIIKD